MSACSNPETALDRVPLSCSGRMNSLRSWLRRTLLSTDNCVYLLLLAVCFLHLAQGSLAVDAIRHAGIAKHMVVEGSWFRPFDPTTGAAYVNKPPFLFWILGLAIAAFGFSTFLVKAVSVSFAAAAVILLFAQIRRLVGECTALLFVLLFVFNRTFLRDVVDLNFEGVALLAASLCFLPFLRLAIEERETLSLGGWLSFFAGILLLLQSKIPYIGLVCFSLLLFLLHQGQLLSILRQPWPWLLAAVVGLIEAAWLWHAGYEYYLAAADNQFVEPLRSGTSELKRLLDWSKSFILSWGPMSLLGLWALYDWRRVRSDQRLRYFLLFWALTAAPIIVLAGNRSRYLLIPMIGFSLAAAIYASHYLSRAKVTAAFKLLSPLLCILIGGCALLGIPLHRADAIVEALRQRPDLLEQEVMVCANDRDARRPDRDARFLRVLLWLEFDRQLTVQPLEQIAVESLAGPLLLNARCESAVLASYSEMVSIERIGRSAVARRQ